MKKEEKKKKSITGPILIFTISLILILLVVWLGFSFFSMRSDNPYVIPIISIENEQIADKVGFKYTKEGIDHVFLFPITLLHTNEDGNSYYLKGHDTQYATYYSDIEEAFFEYELDKEKGRYDFNSLEWEQPLELKIRYMLREDMSYFLDYSVCVLRRVTTNLPFISETFGPITCVIEKDMMGWEIIEAPI